MKSYPSRRRLSNNYSVFCDPCELQSHHGHYNDDVHSMSGDNQSHRNLLGRANNPRHTYGTYIYDVIDAESPYYHTRDPLRCSCRCCPHSLGRRDSVASSYEPAEDRPRHRADAHSDGCRPHEVPSFSHSSGHAASAADYSRTGHRRSSADYKDVYDEASAKQPRPMQHGCMRSTASEKRRPGRDHRRGIIIDVIDRTISQRLKARHGKRFMLSIPPDTASARDIALFLAPDQRYERVVVKWGDEETEPLDDLVPVRDLSNPGARLEVRTRKTVHWS